jgi:hypothetical protein
MHIRLPLASIGIFSVLLATLTSCTGKKEESAERLAVIACEASCLKHKDAGEDLSRGPCLPDAAMPEGWVCDIAHDPRSDVDNIPANQCAAFRLGQAQHFVEVNENCEMFRSR